MLALVLTAVYGALSSSAQGSAIGSDTIEAVARAKAALARAGADPRLSLGVIDETDGRWRATTTVTQAPAVQGLLRIEARVAWAVGATRRDVVLVSLRPEPIR